jgi:hypothetical protein
MRLKRQQNAFALYLFCMADHFLQYRPMPLMNPIESANGKHCAIEAG